MAEKAPNILFIMADQMAARALSIYGNSIVKAPAMEKLAEEGVEALKSLALSYMPMEKGNIPVCSEALEGAHIGRLQ